MRCKIGEFKSKIEFQDGDDLYPAGNLYDEKDFPEEKIKPWKNAGFTEFVK